MDSDFQTVKPTPREQRIIRYGAGARGMGWMALEALAKSGPVHKCYPLGDYVCPKCGKGGDE